MLKKTLFLLALCSILIFYFVLNLRSKYEHAMKENTAAAPAKVGKKRNNPVFVILLSQYRSGSSFVGEIFNQNAKVAYFYEPLFPFGTCPRDEDFGASDYFKKVLNFDFFAIPKLYEDGFRRSGRKNQAGCLNKGVCFAECIKCSKFLSRDTDICRPSKASDTHACPGTINMTKLANFAKTRRVIAFKVVYLCDIAWIKSIIDDSNFNIKIVHLVRDPRALLNSRLLSVNVVSNEAFTKARAVRMCQHMNKLVVFADENLLNSNRYLRIRHEDFALHPFEETRRLYDFVDLQLNDYILNWLKKSTSLQNSKRLSNFKAYSTTRNSYETVIHWRKELNFEAAALIQNLCQYSMRSLGYVDFKNQSEMKNLNLSSLLPPR